MPNKNSKPIATKKGLKPLNIFPAKYPAKMIRAFVNINSLIGFLIYGKSVSMYELKNQQ